MHIPEQDFESQAQSNKHVLEIKKQGGMKRERERERGGGEVDF